MSQKHRKFSPEFKAKIVLELLEENAALNEIASKYNVLPKSLQQWKKQFVQNASSAFENSVSIKQYKEEIEKKENQIDALSKALGQAVIERDWLSKKVKSLGLSKAKSLVEPKLSNISITRQCRLIGIGRTSLYYKKRPSITDMDIRIMNAIDGIYTIFPYYGYRRMYYGLQQKGYKAGKRKIVRFMKLMNIRALCPRKKINTSTPRKENKIYPYLLKDIEIQRPNQVWASDISYIRLNGGFSYLCAVMDLHTRTILSHKLSSTMDENLVINTIGNAIERYGIPEIFNSDQGSQYTAENTIKLLEKHDISISMDAKGRCYDNIFMERFWRTVKQEDVYPNRYETLRQARRGIDNYMKTYNYRRLHSSIGYKAPMEVYTKQLKKAA